MLQVRLDVPVFCAPAEAYGYATGLAHVRSSPSAGATFDWPTAWLAALGPLASAENSVVWYVEPAVEPGGAPLVGLYGIACADREQASSLAGLLSGIPGVEFIEHEQVR